MASLLSGVAGAVTAPVRALAKGVRAATSPPKNAGTLGISMGTQGLPAQRAAAQRQVALRAAADRASNGGQPTLTPAGQARSSSLQAQRQPASTNTGPMAKAL